MLSTEHCRAHNPFDMSTARKRKRVLCVDDDPETCRMVAAVLSPGYEMVSALSAEDAWHRYNDGPFSLVILDYRLCDSNGLDFCERIRRQDYQTPVILITGDPNVCETAVRIAGGQRLIRKGQPTFLEEIYAYAQLLAVTV